MYFQSSCWSAVSQTLWEFFPSCSHAVLLPFPFLFPFPYTFPFPFPLSFCPLFLSFPQQITSTTRIYVSHKIQISLRNIPGCELVSTSYFFFFFPLGYLHYTCMYLQCACTLYLLIRQFLLMLLIALSRRHFSQNTFLGLPLYPGLSKSWNPEIAILLLITLLCIHLDGVFQRVDSYGCLNWVCNWRWVETGMNWRNTASCGPVLLSAGSVLSCFSHQPDSLKSVLLLLCILMPQRQKASPLIWGLVISLPLHF